MNPCDYIDFPTLKNIVVFKQSSQQMIELYLMNI